MTILLRATFPNALRSGRPARTETRGAGAPLARSSVAEARRFAVPGRCARACPPTAPDVDARLYFN
jgi:hypothetical protein